MPRSKTQTKAADAREYDRVTIPLSRDTVEAIRWMEENCGFRGKGRTVDSLVEAVADSRQYIENFVKAGTVLAIIQGGPHAQEPAQQAQMQQLGATQMIMAAVVVDRLRKFVGVFPDEIGEEVKREIKAREKSRAEMGAGPEVVASVSHRGSK